MEGAVAIEILIDEVVEQGRGNVPQLVKDAGDANETTVHHVVKMVETQREDENVLTDMGGG